jgi:hypothetical protein
MELLVDRLQLGFFLMAFLAVNLVILGGLVAVTVTLAISLRGTKQKTGSAKKYRTPAPEHGTATARVWMQGVARVPPNI